MAEFPQDYATPVESTPTSEPSDFATPVINQSPSPSSDVAADRATKSEFGLKDKLPETYNDYYSAFVRGQEKYMRNYIVNQLAIQNNQRRASIMSAIANQKGSALTTEDIAQVDDMINDPRSVIEDHYANKYIEEVNWPKANQDMTSWLNNLTPDESATWSREYGLGREYSAKVQYLRMKQQQAHEDEEGQSWIGWTLDQAKNLTTIYPWIKMHTDGSHWYDLPGKAQENTKNDLLLQPYEEFKNRYDTIFSSLPPGLRRQFADNMVGMSTSDQVMQDVFPLIQPGIEVGAVAGIGSAIFTRNSMRNAIRQQIQSSAAQAGMSPSQQAALAAGNVGSSATQRVWGTIVNQLRRSDPIKEAEEKLPNILRAGRRQLFENDGGDVNGTNMLAEDYERMERDVPAMIRGTTLPERFPGLTLPERNQEILVAAAQAVRERARDLSDRIMNVEEPYQEPTSRNWWSNLILGKSPLDVFGSQAEAGRFAAKVGMSGQRYEQRGAGWVIVKPMLIPEDAPIMRPFYARLPNEKVPEGGVINSFLARFRTPNETQSEWANRNRESATFASSVLENYAWKEAEDIRKMQPLIPFTRGTEKWNDWERVLNGARKVIDPDTNKIGYTYKNIGELNYAYMKAVGRLPDDQEIRAYFAFKRVNELDHVLRTVSIIKHKQRQGTLSHTITIRNPRLPGDVVNSPEFDAVPLPHFPSGDDTVAIVRDNGQVDVRRLNALGMRQRTATFTQSYRDFFKDAIEKGTHKVVELYSPEYYPLSGFKGIKSTDHVRYVIAPSRMLSNKPLDWNAQLPWRGGGHFVYKHNIRLSQLDIREEQIGTQKRQVLAGVNTGWTIPNLVDGKNLEKLVNEARVLLNSPLTAQNISRARDIVENQLHVDWSEFKGWFRPPPVRNPATGQWNRGSKPRFNLTEPFRLHMANENLANKIGEDELKARYPNFLDSRTRSRNQQFMTEFSQERDANEVFTWNNTGTPDTPFYRYEPAPLLDAIPTMNRATNKIANTLAMDDMKIQAVLSWMQEAKPFLNVPDAQLNSSPLYWFHHGDFLKDPLNAKHINELEVARQQVKSFIGQVSIQDAVVHYWSQKLADTIYTSGPLSRLANKLDPIWLAHTIQDPTRFIRAMTFHMKMGLFAIPQILVQGQTYVNILGIAGATRALQGTAGAMMHQWSRINQNPAILAGLGRHLERFGYKPGEWEAIREAGLSTGFLNVGSEYALRDNPMSNKIVQTRWGKFLEFGAIPFTEGERNVRLGSWYTAAKEYAEKKPISQWTNADKLAILDRAAILNGNMNRASNAMYQKGFASLPAQFLTYTIRQAELMWGKRLTSAEKARLLLTNVMAYGLPVGMGITGLPSDYFKNAAIEAGYNPGDNYINTLVTEGIPSTLLALVDHDRYWNVGERFGNTGLNDIFYGDKTIWDLAGGAAFSTLGSFLEAFDPFRQAVMSGIRQDGNAFNITYEHLLQPLREITSFNSFERGVIAAKTGVWVSKNNNPLLRGISPPEALMSFLTGLQPQAVADLRHITDIRSAEESVQKWAEKQFQQEIHRALNAYDEGDKNNGEAFMTNAMMYLNVYAPDERKEEWLARGLDGYQDVVQRVRQSFGLKDVPPWLKDQRRDSYIRSIP